MSHANNQQDNESIMNTQGIVRRTREQRLQFHRDALSCLANDSDRWVRLRGVTLQSHASMHEEVALNVGKQ